MGNGWNCNDYTGMWVTISVKAGSGQTWEWWEEDGMLCSEDAGEWSNRATCSFDGMAAGWYTMKVDNDPYGSAGDTVPPYGAKYNMRFFGKTSAVHLYDGAN